MIKHGKNMEPSTTRIAHIFANRFSLSIYLYQIRRKKEIFSGVKYSEIL